MKLVFWAVGTRTFAPALRCREAIEHIEDIVERGIDWRDDVLAVPDEDELDLFGA